MTAIPISPEERKAILKRVTSEMVAQLIAQHRDDADYISPAQAAGIIDVNPKTLASIDRKKLPRYEIVEGKVIRYRLSEVLSYVQSTRES